MCSFRVPDPTNIDLTSKRTKNSCEMKNTTGTQSGIWCSKLKKFFSHRFPKNIKKQNRTYYKSNQDKYNGRTNNYC